jgi:hypothetical protein
MARVAQTLYSLLPETRILALSAVSIALIALSFPVYSDYCAWLGLSRGGLPHNFFGYILQNIVSPLRISNTYDTTPFSSPKILTQAGKYADVSFLQSSELPSRKGSRPTIGKWVLPQRQISSPSPPAVKAALRAHMDYLATSRPDELHIATSAWEKHGPALFVSHPKEGSMATKNKNEIVHLHEFDGSVQLILTPKDAKTVLEKGWGERFGLSGVVVESGYVMIYAPRDEEELEVVKRVVGACLRYLMEE